MAWAAQPSYTFQGVVDEIQDGDSLVATITVAAAFHEKWVAQRSWRLFGCNARESEQPGGPEATANLAQLLPVGTPVTVQSIRVDPYTNSKYESARYDARIILSDGRDLTALLIADNWAAAWDGKTQPRPVPPWPRP
jgi:endonuclease YncB( thermonuclease family)